MKDMLPKILKKVTQNKRRVALWFVVIVPLAGFFVVTWIFSDLILVDVRKFYLTSEEETVLSSLNLTPAPNREDIAVDSGSITIRGSFYQHTNPSECAVILIHGRSNNRTGVIPYIPLFWKYGCDVLAYDLRGAGSSGGIFQTYGVREKADFEAVLGWLTDRTGLSEDTIGVFGVSLGAAVGMQASVEHEKFAFVIADSVFSDLSTIVHEEADDRFGALGLPFARSRRSSSSH